MWENAIGTGLDGPYLLVVDSQNIVERRVVETGERQGDGLIAVLSGIAPDERYIVSGLQKARPGAPVTPSEYTPRVSETAHEESAE